MKTFKVVVPTVVVARIVITEQEFNGGYDGCPTRLERFIKESKPEYAKCTTAWSWVDGGSMFKMDFIASGDAVIEEINK